jgi:crossover junction endodeoxyribonuclease RuvC
MIRIIGIDPALNNTGWGVIEIENNKMRFIDAGVISVSAKQPLQQRLLVLSNELAEVIVSYQPMVAAIEKTFVSINADSTLKLGNARGAILLTLAQQNLPIFEYDATLIKKTVTGNGKADKAQIMAMLKILLPETRSFTNLKHDGFDALAIAITHFHNLNFV